MILRIAAAGFLIIGVSLAQQAAETTPAFEVTTVKPASPDGGEARFFRFSGERRFTAINHTLKECVAFSFAVTPILISGGPAWIDADRYDIVGLLPGDKRPPAEDIRLMFQALLADRFKLAIHREQKQSSVYNLALGKSRLKIKESPADAGKNPSILIQPSGTGVRLPVRNATMAQFAAFLQRLVMDRPVIDKTGLSGKYDFDLEFSVDGTQLGQRLPSADSDNAADIFTAIGQLGLKLESVKGTVEALVIDRAEKPDAN